MRPSRTGGSVPPGNHTAAPAPVLTVDGTPRYTLTYAGTTPALWCIYELGNVVIGQQLEEYTPPVTGVDASGESGQTVVARGTDAGATTFTTPVSNAVMVP